MITAEAINVESNRATVAGPKRVGRFQLFGDSLTTFYQMCVNTVAEADDLPKTEVQVSYLRLDVVERYIALEKIKSFGKCLSIWNSIIYESKRFSSNHFPYHNPRGLFFSLLRFRQVVKISQYLAAVFPHRCFMFVFVCLTLEQCFAFHRRAVASCSFLLYENSICKLLELESIGNGFERR